MDIKSEKLWLIEYLLRIKDEILLNKIKTMILDMAKEKQEELQPMTLDQFYEKIDRSEQALENGEVISQDQLRKEIETWRTK